MAWFAKLVEVVVHLLASFSVIIMLERQIYVIYCELIPKLQKLFHNTTYNRN